MRARLFLCQKLVTLAVALLFAGAAAVPQDSSDRPPWAKKKSKTDKSKPADPPPDGKSYPEPVNKNNNDTDSNAADPAQRDRIHVSVNLVNVLVSVLDDNNRPAPDLPVEAFQLFEDGVKQKIEIFETETKQPVDIVLMIDASLSAHKEITFEQQAAARFIGKVLRPEDHLAIYSFDETVTQVAGFSGNAEALERAVHNIPGGAGTSIYDALLLGSQRAGTPCRRPPPRNNPGHRRRRNHQPRRFRGRPQSRRSRQHLALHHPGSPGKK